MPEQQRHWGSTGHLSNRAIIHLGIAGRLGKCLSKDQFTFIGDTERPLNAAVLLHTGVRALVIWREKVTRVVFNQTQVRSVIEHRETGVYYHPNCPDDLYLLQNNAAYLVDTDEATYQRIMGAHLREWTRP